MTRGDGRGRLARATRFVAAKLVAASPAGVRLGVSSEASAELKLGDAILKAAVAFLAAELDRPLH